MSEVLTSSSTRSQLELARGAYIINFLLLNKSMNEQMNERNNLSPENLEEQKYAAFQAAENEVIRIMKEINNIFTTTLIREEAEKIIMERYATQMDEAMEKSKQTSKEWFNAIEEAHKKE